MKTTPRRNRFSLRRLWVRIHLWLGLTLGVLGALIGVSGSILVFDHDIDEWLHPARYEISGSAPGLAYSEYATRAAQALEGRAHPTGIRLPDLEEGPIMVFARAPNAGGFLRVYLDAPTGSVLDVTDGVDFIGWVHGFHESLMLRDFRGREIVGVVGIAMLISSLSGIYLWWPARRQFRKALGFRRGYSTSRNLHYTFGFYGAMMLAMLSFTGIFLSFTDAGRAVVAVFSPLSPSPRSVQAREAAEPRITPDDAVAIARGLYPAARVIGVQLPNGPRGVYRILLREAGDTSARSGTAVSIDPRTREVLLRTDRSTRTAGDAFLTMNRLLHEGNWWGSTGRLLTFLTGLLSALLMVTGFILYFRPRRRVPSAAVGAKPGCDRGRVSRLPERQSS